MSGEIFELHHDKHHATYVKGAKDTLDQLAEAADSAPPERPDGDLATAIDEHFGTVVGPSVHRR